MRTVNAPNRSLAVCAAGVLLVACALRPVDLQGGLDRRIAAEVARAGLPGANLAVLRDDGGLYLRAFGLADRDTGVPLDVDARMRIASVSKPITSVAVLVLAEYGALDLDAPVLDMITARLPFGFNPHPGFATLTTRHLLAHCGGFDHERSFDPMLNMRRMATVLEVPSPPPVEAIVVWALSQPPAYAPGTRCVYSNLGYALLGRLIESIVGVDYAQAVQTLVLQPAGIVDMRLAASLPRARLADEPRYHDTRVSHSVFEPEQRVPLPDGGFAIEIMDAHGGWLASAADLVRLVSAIEGRGSSPPLLSADRRRQMLSVPFPNVPGEHGYALGWMVARGGHYFWHDGNLPGSTALLVREVDGTVWALLANGSLKQPRAYDRLRRRMGAVLRRWQ